MRGGAARPLFIVVLSTVLLVGFLLAILPSGSARSGSSTSSTAPQGRMAALQLLKELGFRARSWRQAPGHLPVGDHLLILPAAPEPPPGYEDPEPSEPGDEAEGPRIRHSRRLRDLRHYVRFLDEGGTILLELDESRRGFLMDTVYLTELEGLEVEFIHQGTDARPLAVLRSGEEIRLDEDFDERFVIRETATELEILVKDDEYRDLVVLADVGPGRIALLPDDRILGNGELGRADHALLLVRLIEELDPRGEILFDDYALGDWNPDSPIHLAFAPGKLGFSLHLVLLIVLALWATAWVFEFPRDPEPLRLLSPIARVRAYAGTIVRTRRWDLAARMLRKGVLRRLAARGGIRPAAGEDESGPDAEEVERVLAPLEPLLADPEDRRRARAAFLERGVRNEQDLERLGAELSRLERLSSSKPSQDRT